jgi:hypothetical protein
VAAGRVRVVGNKTNPAVRADVPTIHLFHHDDQPNQGQKKKLRKQPSQKAEIQIPKQKIESSPVKWQTEDFTGLDS